MEKYDTEFKKLVCDTYLELKTISAVCNKLNISEIYTVKILHAYGIRKKQSYNTITKSIESIIINDYLNSNLTEKEIGTKHGCSLATVRNICKRNNIPKRKRVRNKDLIDKLIKCDDDYFENIDTPEASWLLGFIAGDSAVGVKHISTELSIRDVSVLEKIKKFLKADNEIRYRTRTHPVSGTVSTNCVLIIHRKKMCEDLTRLGIGSNKSKELKLPPIKNELISHFMRGLVCSDGSFSISEVNTINFTLVCPVIDILEQFQNILIEKYNFEKTDISYKRGCFKFRCNGNLQVRKIFEYLYPDDMGDAYLDRKYNYCKQHFYNLDNGIRSRNIGDPPLDQYSFTTDLRHLQILKSSEIPQYYTSPIKIFRENKSKSQPKPRTQLEILLGLNK